jgi:hypothetical protein
MLRSTPLPLVVGLCVGIGCDPFYWQTKCFRLQVPQRPAHAINVPPSEFDISHVMGDELPPLATAPIPSAPAMECRSVGYHCNPVPEGTSGCGGTDKKVYPVGCLTEIRDSSGTFRYVCTDLLVIPRGLSYYEYDFSSGETKSPDAYGPPHWHFAGVTASGHGAQER